MLNQELKVSPHGSFKVTQLCESVAICEATKGDRHNWGNATPSEPAFLVYLGCKKDEVPGYIKTFNIFYRCDYCEARKPKHLKGFEAEIKIRGMQREADTYAFGLDYLIQSESAKHPNYSINLDNCMDDMAENYIYQSEDYQNIPLEKIKEILLKGIDDLIDDFADNPNKYLKQNLSNQLIKLAAEYNQESIDSDEYDYYANSSYSSRF